MLSTRSGKPIKSCVPLTLWNVVPSIVAVINCQGRLGVRNRLSIYLSCLWNGSNVGLIDDGPFSSCQGRLGVRNRLSIYLSCLWNGSNVGLIDDGPFSSCQGRSTSTSSFCASLLQPIDCVMSTNSNHGWRERGVGADQLQNLDLSAWVPACLPPDHTDLMLTPLVLSQNHLCWDYIITNVRKL